MWLYPNSIVKIRVQEKNFSYSVEQKCADYVVIEAKPVLLTPSYDFGVIDYEHWKDKYQYDADGNENYPMPKYYQQRDHHKEYVKHYC